MKKNTLLKHFKQKIMEFFIKTIVALETELSFICIMQSLFSFVFQTFIINHPHPEFVTSLPIIKF